ncbi:MULTISPECIES: peptidoglycan-binding domain-containing protein [Leptolyngbya]|uniref:peptidoglycan-binding domain-containing protein n=1 Tax=Leptolyngbya TaxID=47251 RepID=UPI0016861CD0|nr:peptidoglycan-binding domain-containing protein [Leptolyngbya sp. FACHB-1624]MBD1859959.1 peptidoglycan-binding protein [Leptolyngbya sp. FACHB-1624]
MDSFIQESQKHLAVLQEYYKLECQQRLNDTEVNRVQEILEQAQKDPLLDFLIDEVDHILAHEFGLIDEQFIQQQQQKLESLINSTWLEHLLSSYTRESDLPSVQEAQTRLKQEGLYNGQIDGIFGPITKQAFRALRRRIQERLEKQELPTDSIDGILKEDQSVTGTVHREGKKLDFQEVELLNLEAKFS